MAEWTELPPRERAKRYRERAAEAERFSRVTNEDVRDAYLMMAKQWHALADQAERLDTS